MQPWEWKSAGNWLRHSVIWASLMWRVSVLAQGRVCVGRKVWGGRCGGFGNWGGHTGHKPVRGAPPPDTDRSASAKCDEVGTLNRCSRCKSPAAPTALLVPGGAGVQGNESPDITHHASSRFLMGVFTGSIGDLHQRREAVPEGSQEAVPEGSQVPVPEGSQVPIPASDASLRCDLLT